MSLISMHGAWLSFSDAPLLDNAELHIEDNERVCLVGRNGAGKSTLMKILNREQGLDDGRIIYEQDLVVARLQQDPPRNVEGSVYDFVAEGIEEQAEYLKRYHDISRLVMTDPSDRNLNEMARVQEMLDHHNIHVVYTKEAETADAYIEKFAHENGRKYHVTVATSDGLEQIIITGQGCHLLSAREFEREVEAANQTLRETIDGMREKSSNQIGRAHV